MLVPIWKLARASQAFIMASCARSSAAVGSPQSVRAKARRWGISATSSRLKASSRSAGVERGWSAPPRHQPFADPLRPSSAWRRISRNSSGTGSLTTSSNIWRSCTPIACWRRRASSSAADGFADAFVGHCSNHALGVRCADRPLSALVFTASPLHATAKRGPRRAVPMRGRHIGLLANKPVWLGTLTGRFRVADLAWPRGCQT